MQEHRGNDSDYKMCVPTQQPLPPHKEDDQTGPNKNIKTLIKKINALNVDNSPMAEFFQQVKSRRPAEKLPLTTLLHCASNPKHSDHTVEV